MNVAVASDVMSARQVVGVCCSVSSRRRRAETEMPPGVQDDVGSTDYSIVANGAGNKLSINALELTSSVHIALYPLYPAGSNSEVYCITPKRPFALLIDSEPVTYSE